MTARGTDHFLRFLSLAMVIVTVFGVASKCRAAFSNQTSVLIPQGYGSDGQNGATSPVVNFAPYEEPFEEYAEDSSIDGTNGWVGTAGSTLISTNETLIAALNTYAMMLDLPLTNAPHEKVLCVLSPEGIRNKFGVSNSTVFTDFMWLPSLSPFRNAVAEGLVPSNAPEDQLAFFVNFDGRLAVYAKASSGSNAWHELEEHGSESPSVMNPTPLLKTGEWVRVSIEQNYVGSRWSIRLNQNPPISDAEGWDAAVGGSRPGPWFDMANTSNAGMSALLAGDAVAYLDDLQVKLTNPVPESTTTTTTTSSTSSSTTTSPFTNVIPYAEPFEDMPPYVDGFSIAGINGWVGNDGAAVISTNSALIAAIDDFVNAGNLLPIPGAPHTKVLCVAEDAMPRGRLREPMTIANRIDGNTKTVFTDLLWLPRPGTAPPSVTTNDQLAFHPYLNGALVIWHEHSGTPEWHRLTNAPILSTGEWVRVTLEQNFTHSRWRLRVNGQEHISDAKGWNTAAGTIQPGTWFNMVQKGGSMKKIEFEGKSCIDDLVVQTSNPFPDGLLIIIR